LKGQKTNAIKYDIFTCEDIISSHVRISYRFYQFVTTRYTTDFYIIVIVISYIPLIHSFSIVTICLQNYGDESDAYGLINPSIYSNHGVYEKDFFQPRDQYEVRSKYSCINNGNWTEWNAIWSEIIRVILKSNEHVARVQFEITSMISDQICTTQSLMATLLDPFRNHTSFGEKQQSFGNYSSCKILHTMTFCLSLSWNFLDYFNRTLKFDLLFSFTVPFSLAEKKMRFRAKNGAIR